MDHNRFSKLPPALAAATRLTTLSFAFNAARLHLTSGDVDGVLARMASLEVLELPPESAPEQAVAERLAQRLPRLRVALMPPEGNPH